MSDKQTDKPKDMFAIEQYGKPILIALMVVFVIIALYSLMPKGMRYSIREKFKQLKKKQQKLLTNMMSS